MKKILFRAKGSGRVIELMRFDKPGPNQGDSLRRTADGKVLYRAAGTDIAITGTIEKRRPLVPGGTHADRGEKAAYIDGMESTARFKGAAPASPMQLLRAGRRGGNLADKAGVTVRAEAGWFGTKPSKKSTGVVNPKTGKPTKIVDYSKENARLRGAYAPLGMVRDRAKIKAEMDLYKGDSLSLRRQAAKMLREKPQLIRMPKAPR
jgi:hypothetical protein